jgi:RNA polymerase sigma-32 factor
MSEAPILDEVPVEDSGPHGHEVLPNGQNIPSAPQASRALGRKRPSSNSGPAISASAMAAYLRDIRCHPVMSRAEEHDVAVTFASTGDRKCAARLVNANLRLVVKIVLEYRAERGNLMDLIQEGNIGLIHAVEKYDPRRGTRLGTYASWWIRAYVLKYIMSNARLVKLGTTQAQRRLFFGMRKAESRLQVDASPLADEDIARAMDVPVEVVAEMKQRLSAGEASLDARSRYSDAATFGDSFCGDPMLQPDSQCETKDLRDVLKTTLAAVEASLTGRELEIFRARMVSETPVTLATLADKFGVSRERVRQLEERLKEKIRQHLADGMRESVCAKPHRPRDSSARISATALRTVMPQEAA